MKRLAARLLAALLLFAGFSACAEAASIKNQDNKAYSLIIVEEVHKKTLVLEANQQIDICPRGCFITLMNGDKYALRGDEKLEIMNNNITFH